MKNNLLATIFDQVRILVIQTDTKGNIRYVNPFCSEFLGFSKDELIGKNVKMIVTDPHQAQHDQYLANY